MRIDSYALLLQMNLGVLPFQYLAAPDGERAGSLFFNAQQILAQYQVQMEQKKSTTLAFAFRPFKELSPTMQADFMRQTRRLISAGKNPEAITNSQNMIRLALKGLRYYQTYDRFYLGVSIVFGYLGWMAYILGLVLKETNLIKPSIKLDLVHQPFWKSKKAIKGFFSVFSFFVITLLAVQSLPWSNYLYCLVPVLLWMSILLNVDVFIEAARHVYEMPGAWRGLVVIVVCMLGLELLVWGFFNRQLLSIGLICISLWGPFNWSNVSKTLAGWCIFSMLLSYFPSLPVVGRETNYNLVFIAGVIAFICGLFSKIRSEASAKGKYSHIINLQLVLVLVATVIVRHTSYSIGAKLGLPVVNQLISWAILVTSFSLPVLCSTAVNERMLSIGLAVIPPYILLSTTYEALFVVVLCGLLFFWHQMELEVSIDLTDGAGVLDFVNNSLSTVEEERNIRITDIRRALFFIFFILTAFFGTGNIASINSFEPASVYCFLTVFNPFVMGSLMMVKNFIPFILVACVFRAIHITCRIPERAVFLIALLMSDFMALHFFFLVQDYGSWLEIGTSISHYVIVMCMVIFLKLLFGLSYVLTTFTVFNSKLHAL
ncbi:hypothetical protein ScPMuIL_001785 [Solemya velum]